LAVLLQLAVGLLPKKLQVLVGRCKFLQDFVSSVDVYYWCSLYV
jgi:hypothetical protein